MDPSIWKFSEDGIPLFLYTKKKNTPTPLSYSDYLNDVVDLFYNQRDNFNKCCGFNDKGQPIFNQMFYCIESNATPDVQNLGYFYEDNIQLTDYFDANFIRSFRQDVDRSMLIPYKDMDKSVYDKYAYTKIQPNLETLKEIQKEFLKPQEIKNIIMGSHNPRITDYDGVDFNIIIKICRAFGIGYTKNSESIEYYCSQNKQNKIIRYFMLRDIGSTTYKPYGVKKPKFTKVITTDSESLNITENIENDELVSNYQFNCKESSDLHNFFSAFEESEKAGLFSGGSFIIPVIKNGDDKYFCLPYKLKGSGSDILLSFDATFGGTQEHNTSSEQTFFNELFEESGYLSFLKKDISSKSPLYRPTTDDVKLKDMYSVFNTSLLDVTPGIRNYDIVNLTLDLVDPRGNLTKNDEIEIPKKSIGDTFIQFGIEINTNKSSFDSYLAAIGEAEERAERLRRRALLAEFEISDDSDGEDGRGEGEEPKGHIMPYLQYFDEVSPYGKSMAYSGFFLIKASSVFQSFLVNLESCKKQEGIEKKAIPKEAEKEEKKRAEKEIADKYDKLRVDSFKSIDIKKLVKFDKGTISGVFNDLSGGGVITKLELQDELKNVVTFFKASQYDKCIGEGNSILRININGNKKELTDININYNTNIEEKEFLPNDYLIMKTLAFKMPSQPRRPGNQSRGGRKYKKSKKIKKRKTVKKKKSTKRRIPIKRRKGTKRR